MQHIWILRTKVCAKSVIRLFPRLSLFTAILLLCLNAPALPNYDPFADQTADGGSTYTVGSPLAGQTNAPNYRWNSLGANFPPSKPIIAADNLTFPGLPASTGGSVAFVPTTNPSGGGGARLDLKLTSAGTAYYSFLLKITGLDNVPTYNTNNPISAFCDDPAEQGAQVARLGSRLVTKRSGAGYVLGIGRNNLASEFVYDTAVHNLNEVVLVVASYELDPGVSTNVNLWINPPSSTFGASTPPAPTVSAVTFSSTAGNINTSGPRAVAVLCQFGSAPSGVLDDLRVSRTWTGVTGGLEFLVQPTTQSGIVGSNITFVASAGGTPPIGYTWQKNNSPLSNGGNVWGVTNSTLTITNLTHANEGTYSVIATNGIGSITSQDAYLYVNDPILDPRFVLQPVSQTNVAGATVTFQAWAEGTPDLTYQWQKNGNILFDGFNVEGASTTNLTLKDITSAEQAEYAAVVINGLGTAQTSSVAVLTVDIPLSISAQPSDRAVAQGASAVVSVGVSGTGPFTYQWQRNGENITNAIQRSYVITNVVPGTTGDYRVIVTGKYNSDTSHVAVVSIAASTHLWATNLVALRIGNGAQALVESGNSMALDQFTTSGSYLNSLNIPDNGPTALVASGPNVVTSPSSITGNSLTKSANGRFLVIGAYNTNLNYTAALHNSTSAAVPRGIALVDSQARYTLAVSSTNTTFSQTFWRGAASDGTNNYWGWARSPGTYYFGFDGPAALIQNDWNNLRSITLANGSLYCVSAVSGKNGVLKLEGLPVTPAPGTVLVNSGSTGSSDCDVSPAGNLIYLADDRAAASGGGVQRWDFDGSNWNLSYTLTDQLPNGARYLAVDFSDSTPVIFASTSDAANTQLVRIPDTGPGATGTIIAYAGVNQIYRGLRLGPTEAPPEPAPVLSATHAPDGLILNWGGSYLLQSAPDLFSPFVDVINGVRPYTNSTTVGQKFFRLRQ